MHIRFDHAYVLQWMKFWYVNNDSNGPYAKYCVKNHSYSLLNGKCGCVQMDVINAEHNVCALAL